MLEQGSINKLDDFDGFEAGDKKEDGEIVEAPKKRGRPRKDLSVLEHVEINEVPEKRSRGRPRKNDVVEKASNRSFQCIKRHQNCS